MRITIFDKNDITKQGKMKVKHNAQIMNEEEFLEYALDNKLTVTPRYIDNIADLSNGKMIKASYGGIMIGTTNISKQVFALNKGEIK